MSEPELKTIHLCPKCGWVRPEDVKSIRCIKCNSIIVPKVIKVG